MDPLVAASIRGIEFQLKLLKTRLAKADREDAAKRPFSALYGLLADEKPIGDDEIDAALYKTPKPFPGESPGQT